MKKREREREREKGEGKKKEELEVSKKRKREGGEREKRRGSPPPIQPDSEIELRSIDDNGDAYFSCSSRKGATSRSFGGDLTGSET